MVILSIGLGGCFYQDISKFEIDRANKFCEDKGGIFEMTAQFAGQSWVTCGDGSNERIKASNLFPER